MVISHNGSGLCNRIKSLLSAMRIAEYNNDSKVKVDWPLGEGSIGGCHFNDLFENQNMIIRMPDYPSGATFYNLWRFAILPDDPIPHNFSDGCGIRYNNTQKFKGHTHTRSDGRNIDLEFDRIPEKVKQNYLKQISKLKIKKNILEKVKEFSKNFNKNTVSVQVRSWNDDPVRKQQYFNIEDFYKIMDSMKNSNFFVTADAPKIIDLFKERYKNRIITRENYKEVMGGRGRWQKEGIIEAMVDLLLLSKNKTLIGTYISTFSEMSWWFSNCKQKTYIL